VHASPDPEHDCCEAWWDRAGVYQHQQISVRARAPLAGKRRPRRSPWLTAQLARTETERDAFLTLVEVCAESKWISPFALVDRCGWSTTAFFFTILSLSFPNVFGVAHANSACQLIGYPLTRLLSPITLEKYSGSHLMSCSSQGAPPVYGADGDLPPPRWRSLLCVMSYLTDMRGKDMVRYH
jgi:hypothetical protein